MSGWRGLAALAVLAGVSASARAEGQPVEVEVGQSVAFDVGFARGVICDDLEILDADVRAKSDETNSFVVTGKAIGETLCRVGTDPLHVRFLFDVHVIAPRPKPAPPAPPPPPKPAKPAPTR